MKKALSIQSIILIFATLISLAITIYVGSFSIDTATFYSKALLVNTTFMGDAFFAFGIVFFLLFFFNTKSMSLKLLIAILISLSITQVIKNIFSGLPLQLFFEEGILQNSSEALFKENIISSHTSIAFTLASFLVLSTKNIFFKVFSILLAITVAITRVELAGDSLLALAIGLLPAIISLLYLYNMKQKKQTNKHAYYYKSRKESKGSARQLLRV